MFKESSTTFHIPVDMLEQEYLRRILKAHVYDVAKETPLHQAKLLSARTENKILLKREDLQSVFSFKLRGAYNKMANLTPEERARGVIAASAGNHAQGVALAASQQTRLPCCHRDADYGAGPQNQHSPQIGRRSRPLR